MKLICLSRYENRQLFYRPGDVFEADEKLFRLLMSDSPESFAEVQDENSPDEIIVPDGTKVVRQRRKK